jgi:integrase
VRTTSKVSKSSEKRFHFTERSVAGIEPPVEKRASYRDSEVRELGLLVQTSGFKSYFWFRKVRGKPLWKTIASTADVALDQAREQARSWSVAAAEWKRGGYKEDKNPFGRPRQEPTFEIVVDAYVERHLKAHANHPLRAEKDARWTLDKYLSQWKSSKLGEISRTRVRQLHDDLGKKNGRYTANRVLQFLKTTFNFAIHQEMWRGENPAEGIKLYHEVKRTRFIQQEEMPRLFGALATEESPDLRDYVLLSLATGARKSDVMGMRWQDVQLNDNRWQIPHPKNNVPYTIALPPEAVKILKNRQHNRVNDWVFPSHGKSGHLMGLKRRWAELLKRAGIVGLRQHDLRRTFGSFQAMGGASLIVIGKSLGHTSLGATSIYSQLALDPVRASVESAVGEIFAAGKKRPKLLVAENA